MSQDISLRVGIEKKTFSDDLTSFSFGRYISRYTRHLRIYICSIPTHVHVYVHQEQKEKKSKKK